MWCGKKCGAKGKAPSFIEVFAAITPNIIWRMKVGTGRSSARLRRYVQILIPFRSGARASHQQLVGCGAKHVFNTSVIGGHIPLNALAPRKATAGDCPPAGQTSAGPDYARTH